MATPNRTTLTAFAVMTVISWPSQGSAQTRESYVSGQELGARHQLLVQEEGGRWLDVPFDYADSSHGTTPIYYWFMGGYDQAQPTMAVFLGGPGLSSHFAGEPIESWIGQIKRLNFNVLMFDQRGVAFSRPKEETGAFYQATFYSSEYTARDLDQIRNSLQIESLSVYGKSYGTVPATMYASSRLFARHTRSLILEGVVSGGFDYSDLHNRFFPYMFQAFFDGLPPVSQIDLKTMAQENGGVAFGITDAAAAAMMYNGTSGLAKLRQQLVLDSSGENQSQISRRRQIAQTFQDWVDVALSALSKDKVHGVEDVVNSILSYRDLGMTNEDAAFRYGLRADGRVVRLKQLDVVEAMKNERDVFRPETEFLASDYPTPVPTYYLQGDTDGAVSPWDAVNHWKSSSSSMAFLLLQVGGSHFVSGSLFNEEHRAQFDTYLSQMFVKMLAGRPIERDDVNRTNMSGVSKFELHADRREADELLTRFNPAIRFPNIEKNLSPLRH